MLAAAAPSRRQHIYYIDSSYWIFDPMSASPLVGSKGSFFNLSFFLASHVCTYVLVVVTLSTTMQMKSPYLLLSLKIVFLAKPDIDTTKCQLLNLSFTWKSHPLHNCNCCQYSERIINNFKMERQHSLFSLFLVCRKCSFNECSCSK